MDLYEMATFLHCEAEVWVLVGTHGLGTTSPSLILSCSACFTCGKQPTVIRLEHVYKNLHEE